jgi:hypothetical protein
MLDDSIKVEPGAAVGCLGGAKYAGEFDEKLEPQRTRRGTEES